MAAQPLSFVLMIAGILAFTSAGCRAGTEPTARVATETSDERLESGVASGVHLQIVLEVGESGAVELVSASELAGPAIVSELPKGDYIVGVALGDEILSVEAVPGDPFQAHGFGGSDASHHLEHQPTATLKIKVPRAGLDSAHLSEMVFHLHRLTPGTSVERVDPETIRALDRDGGLETIAEKPLAELVGEIRERGQRVVDR